MESYTREYLLLCTSLLGDSLNQRNECTLVTTTSHMHTHTHDDIAVMTYYAKNTQCACRPGFLGWGSRGRDPCLTAMRSEINRINLAAWQPDVIHFYKLDHIVQLALCRWINSQIRPSGNTGPMLHKPQSKWQRISSRETSGIDVWSIIMKCEQQNINQSYNWFWHVHRIWCGWVNGFGDTQDDWTLILSMIRIW